MWRKERVAAGAKVTRGLDCTPQGGQVSGERLDQGVGVWLLEPYGRKIAERRGVQGRPTGGMRVLLTGSLPR